MKIVTALIRPEQLPAVKQALFDAQLRHFTATTAVGTGSRSEQEMYRGQQREITLLSNPLYLQSRHGYHHFTADCVDARSSDSAA